MSIGVILYIDPAGKINWRRASGTGQTPQPLADGIACRAAMDENRSLLVRLVLPGTKVSSRILDMPDTSEENARAAVGFLMEDNLAVPVAKTHLVSKKLEDGKRLVLAVAHADMESWLGELKEMDIRPDEVTVDFQLLAPTGQPASVETDGHRYFQQEQGDGFVLDRDTLGELDQNGFAGTDDMPVPSVADRGGLFDLFAVSGALLNMLQGPYDTQASLMEYFKPLARVAVLALVVFVFYLGHLGLEARAWRQAADVLDSQAEILFKQAFPDVTRIVNIRAQLKSRTAGAEEGGEDNFMLLNSRLFDVLAKNNEVQLDKMRYGSNDGRLYVTLSTGSFELLEGFKRELMSGSLMVQDQGARQDGTRVSGDFALEVTP
ncbi:type II secretion system protein GspL [Emcibacter sp.]|uniref:type II secretion system protein GspL n=1 Tax=Emcibacter sp. TaxID=1979954 RepID=UPI002AA7069F|nr:type II secretion system protein GspL [Emcibacter sp.]